MGREVRRDRCRGAVAALVCLGVLAPAALAEEEGGLPRLEAEIERLAELARGTVGVGGLHLESGREVYLNRHERFPMASSYKVPIAVRLLRRVDAGEVSLSKMIELAPGDLHPGSGTLTSLFDDPGVILSLRNLLELMLLISDNSATDLVLAEAGGASAVTECMASLGFPAIRIDRPTESLIADYLGIEGLGVEVERTPERFAELVGELPEERREKARESFDRDLRDTATPESMTRLLAGLWRGELLSAESTELLLDIMGRSTTGKERIRGFLLPDAVVAHKTGTIGGTTNDVGIVTLPADAGHVVVVVLIKESELEVSGREQAIAHIARAVHDYFLFQPE